MSDVNTSLALTGFHSGLSSTVQTTVGTISGGSYLTGTTGFTVSKEDSDEGKPFDVVSLTGDVEVEDPATITIEALYSQDSKLSELDLDLRWAGIPDDSELSVVSSTGNLNVSRRGFSGTGNYGVPDKPAKPGNTGLKIDIWIKKPHDLTADSALTLKLVSVEAGGGGPVQKTLLEKLVVNLG